MEFRKALETRRSNYTLSNETVVSDDIVSALIAHALEFTPSAYDARSQRVLLLFGESHLRLWKIVLEALRKIVPEASFPKTEKKIAGFSAGRGTVLFYDDSAVTDGLAKANPLYARNFERWAVEQGGMLQSNVWVALADVGYGASLQHYGELIEDAVKEAFAIPSTWRMSAQMPFGKILAPARAKDPDKIHERLLVKR
ncbi:MAG: nitroreductase family protein [Candidatus Izemoplasmatales bacterium]